MIVSCCAGAVVGQPLPEETAPLQVLFLGDDGHHEPAQRARQILPYMATQGIHVTYTEDPQALSPDVLSRYDVLLMYGNRTSITRAQEQALLDFVAEGGGFVPVHAASAMFGGSGAFINLVGGAFQRHGTGTFRTNVVRPEHPAMQGVPDFESWDETYVHMKHNPDKVVLAVREEGGHEEPWTWVRSHGDGRVFYTAWGHDERTWSNPGFQKLLEQGIRWAAGDGALTADLAPPALTYVEGTLPNYPPGVGWGITGEPYTEVQEPLRPEASLQQAALDPGFRMELFAAEPDVVNPIDLAWDEQGRLWITETVDYPNRFEPGRRGQDRIKILEDTDGDGQADTFTVFADSLNIPTSLTLARGGAIVAQAPDMLFLKDTDGDDRADVREVLFTGWGTYDTHAGPNNLRYGLDNQIWGALGYSGFDGVVGGDSLRFTQGFYRFAPDGSRLEYLATTDNNTWGLGFSEEGLVFGSTANDNPSVYLAVPHRFYDAVHGWEREVLPSIADTSAFSPTTERVRQVDWHGRYTSAAGHELYTARSFPEAYWNRKAFVGGPTGHLLGKFALEPEGSGFRAHNEWNLVASRDAWFAPIQAKVGPDGALWMIDWYNPVIQHNPTPPGYEAGEGNAYETELRDRQHSRIYRIVYEGASDSSRQGGLGDAAPEELVEALRDDNMFWRLTAQRLLVERGETDVLPQLYRLAQDERVDEIGLNVGAIHALWTMHGLGALQGSNEEASAVAVDALHHPSAGVRRAALMVLPRNAEMRDQILRSEVLRDPAITGGSGGRAGHAAVEAAEARVRLAALLALAEMPESEQAGEVVAEFIGGPEHADDPWLRDAATAAAARHSAGFLQSLLQQEGRRPTDTTHVAHLSRVVRTVAGHYAAGAPRASLVPTLAAVESAPSVLAESLLDGLVAGWPEGEAPAFTAEDRARLRALRSDVPPPQAERLQALAARWGQSRLFSQAE